MVRLTIIALVMLGIMTSCGQRLVARATVSDEVVRTIERQVVMPPRASPLAEYSRFYAPNRINGRTVVVGVFLRGADGLNWAVGNNAAPVDGVSGAYSVPADRLPVVLGGGCLVVSITFDVSTQHLLPAAPGELGACNGPL
jgi:hypothetical protein